jgi:hypothetical protein
MRFTFLRTSVLVFLALMLMAASCGKPDTGGGTTIKDPSTFTASVTGETNVDLSWSAVIDATGYMLERKPDGGTYATVATSLAKTATIYSDASPEAGKSYTYRLKTLRDDKKSNGVESNKVNLPPPGTPMNLTESLEPVWLSKKATDGTPSSAELALPSVTKNSTGLSFSEAGEALYYLGGLCTKVSASVTGTFKVFADDIQLWTGTGNTGELAVFGKQTLSLVSTGSGAVTNPVITCPAKPTKTSLNSSYIGGKWGAPFKWGTSSTGLVATHAANLPDGRVVSWSAWKELAFGTQGDPPVFENKTKGYVWNPVTSAFTAADSSDHDMFCAGLAMLSDGRVFGGGGGSFDSAGGAPAISQYKTSYFDFRTSAWSPGTDSNMKLAHWYGTAVALPDNRIFIVGGSGGSSTAEILSGNTWTQFTDNVTGLFPTQSDIAIGGGFPISVTGGTPPVTTTKAAEQWELDEVQQWYPYLNIAPSGTLLQSGPIARLNSLTIGGNTVDIKPAGATIPASHAKMRTWGNYVMFDEGKILVSGGSTVRGHDATNTAIIMDIRGGGVNVQTIPTMRFKRSFQNSVVLPNGDVMMIGGNNNGKQMSDQGFAAAPEGNPTDAKKRWPSDISTQSVLTPELYSPATNSWRDLTNMTVPRNYHSVALLLQDGRVLAAGGGLCGDTCATNHPDGQIYEPAYLFNIDGSPASRPVIASLSVSNNADGYPKIGYGQQFSVSMTGLGDSSTLSKFTMVKLSAVTHGINTDLRFLEYTNTKGNLTGSGNSYQLTTTANNNVLTPGYYFLFALNDKGVPSVAKVIQVQ